MSTENKVISIEYELREKGKDEVLDSNMGREPLSFVSGKNQLIPGLEKELVKLNAGDSATITVSPQEAYGEYDANALQAVPRSQFGDIDLKEGMILYGQGEDGSTVQVTVKEFDDEKVIVDFNHPLAGKELEFKVNVLESREATPDEVISGQVGGHDHSCGCGTGGCH
ncbi:MAG: peptidylprolyl isomerase [Epsilonproteobacteria bacterium]|nr:peptidylprolyl isomerase [Campylobacterota bacterium]